MPISDAATWSARIRQTLLGYDEALLRLVAGNLIKPRNQWPAEELLERLVVTFDNPVAVDRRLGSLSQASRQVLALIVRSRQPVWRFVSLVELVLALGHPDGVAPVRELLEYGLLAPVRPEGAGKLRTIEHWMGSGGLGGLEVYALPAVAARASGEPLGLPVLAAAGEMKGAAVEADGLEWLLRVAVLWQQVKAAPLRRTQGGTFFKRDLDRLRGDVLLGGPLAENLAEVPDPALLAAALADGQGVVVEQEGELRAGPLPEAWERGLFAALESLYVGLFRLAGWEPSGGLHVPAEGTGDPYPSAYLLVLALLAELPEGAWARPEDLGAWLEHHHPYWVGQKKGSAVGAWVETFCLGVLYPLKVVQAGRSAEGEWRVRLSAHGRALAAGGPEPAPPPVFPQTLLVQPNLEILAYRQGLTPGLVARLTQFATWKSLSAACTLQLEPQTVYRGLESGLTYESILGTLEQHGTRAVPSAVVDLLRTWAQKRDRITVYPAAALLEFATPGELNEALARGLPAQRLTDRLALVPNEEEIDYKHFRLAGNRDYTHPPDQCVGVEPDGVTLSIDSTRSDLLLESELPRFAEAVPASPAGGKRQFRVTPASLAAGLKSGMTLASLESWYEQRTGGKVPASVRLFLVGPHMPAAGLKTQLVLQVATAEMADGLVQWPGTRGLIEERLGPTALVVEPENAERLKAVLGQLGLTVEG